MAEPAVDTGRGGRVAQLLVVGLFLWVVLALGYVAAVEESAPQEPAISAKAALPRFHRIVAGDLSGTGELIGRFTVEKIPAEGAVTERHLAPRACGVDDPVVVFVDVPAAVGATLDPGTVLRLRFSSGVAPEEVALLRVLDSVPGRWRTLAVAIEAGRAAELPERGARSHVVEIAPSAGCT